MDADKEGNKEDANNEWLERVIKRKRDIRDTDQFPDIPYALDSRGKGERIRSFFNKELEERKLIISRIARFAHIDTGYCHEIFNGSKIAARDYYISIAIAMGLDRNKTDEILTLAKHGILDPDELRDCVISHAIEKNLNYDQLYKLLDDLGVMPLDTIKKGK